jgi:hypothetical protein
MKKYEFLSDSVREVNNPTIDYSYIYAPNATRINVASVETIFFGDKTVVETNCDDIRRGNWYLKNGRILDRNNPNFYYTLTFEKDPRDTFFEIAIKQR